MSAGEGRVELESRIGFLEHTLDTLNEVVIDQGRAIEALERRLESLEARSGSNEDPGAAGSTDLRDHRPPHY